MTKFDPMESFANMRHEFGEHGGVNMSIEASTTFTVMHAETMPEIFQGHAGPDQGGCYLYGRHFNPTVYVLGRQLAAYEGAEAGYCSASGMSAISAAILQLCGHGDHVISSRTVYGGTFALFHDYLPEKAGIDTTFVDASNLREVESAVTDRSRALYIETLSNPTLRVSDIPKLSDIAKRHGLALVVDNTFCPLIISPIQLGADVVVHSLTKFINGASDIVAGAVCGSTEFIQSLMDLHHGSLMLLGPTLDPRTAFEISSRLPHLGLRMAEHGRRALEFSKRLQDRGVAVTYPGLVDHPDHAVLESMRNPGYGHGGVLTIDTGSTERANELMEVLQNRDRFGFMAVSLGYFDTLMSCSATSTSSELSETEREQAAISPGLVRISLGFTGSIEQRWTQLEDALDIVGLA